MTINFPIFHWIVFVFYWSITQYTLFCYFQIAPTLYNLYKNHIRYFGKIFHNIKNQIKYNLHLKNYGRSSGQCKPPANFYLVSHLPFQFQNRIMIGY